MNRPKKNRAESLSTENEYRPGLVQQWPREVYHLARRVQHPLVKSLTISKARDLRFGCSKTALSHAWSKVRGKTAENACVINFYDD